jgi:hypothetical protein
MGGLRAWCMLVLLAALASPAAADPLALRHGVDGRAVVVEGGYPSISAGYWVGPALGLALDWRLPAAAVSGSIGTRKTVAQGPRHGGVDLFVAGGLLVPLVDPGVAITASPAIQMGRRGPKGHVTFGVAAPMEALLVPRARLRIPVLLELRVGGNLGPLWLGLRGGVGPVLNFPGATGFTVQWSLWVRVPAASRDTS